MSFKCHLASTYIGSQTPKPVRRWAIISQIPSLPDSPLPCMHRYIAAGSNRHREGNNGQHCPGKLANITHGVHQLDNVEEPINDDEGRPGTSGSDVVKRFTELVHLAMLNHPYARSKRNRCKTCEPSDGAWTCLDEQTSGGAGVILPTVPARNARRGECPNGSSRDGTSACGMEPDGWLSDCLF